MKTLRLLVPLAILTFQTLALFGCSTDKDPNEKINAPGYYNGPMKPKGANAPGGQTPPP